MTMWDAVLYSWICVFWLAACIAFPPFALAYLLIPVWHRRRARRRTEWRRTSRRQAMFE